MMIRACLPPASFTRCGRIFRLSSSGSSAPPTIRSRPSLRRPLPAAISEPPCLAARPRANRRQHSLYVLRQHHKQIAILHRAERASERVGLGEHRLDPIRAQPALAETLLQEPRHFTRGAPSPVIVLLEDDAVEPGAEA